MPPDPSDNERSDENFINAKWISRDVLIRLVYAGASSLTPLSFQPSTFE